MARILAGLVAGPEQVGLVGDVGVDVVGDRAVGVLLGVDLLAALLGQQPVADGVVVHHQFAHGGRGLAVAGHLRPADVRVQVTAALVGEVVGRIPALLGLVPDEADLVRPAAGWPLGLGDADDVVGVAVDVVLGPAGGDGPVLDQPAPLGLVPVVRGEVRHDGDAALGGLLGGG